MVYEILQSGQTLKVELLQIYHNQIKDFLKRIHPELEFI